MFKMALSIFTFLALLNPCLADFYGTLKAKDIVYRYQSNAKFFPKGCFRAVEKPSETVYDRGSFITYPEELSKELHQVGQVVRVFDGGIVEVRWDLCNGTIASQTANEFVSMTDLKKEKRGPSVSDYVVFSNADAKRQIGQIVEILSAHRLKVKPWQASSETQQDLEITVYQVLEIHPSKPKVKNRIYPGDTYFTNLGTSPIVARVIRVFEGRTLEAQMTDKDGIHLETSLNRLIYSRKGYARKLIQDPKENELAFYRDKTQTVKIGTITRSIGRRFLEVREYTPLLNSDERSENSEQSSQRVRVQDIF